MTVFCVVDGCQVSGKHLGACADDDCPGCMPRMAGSDSLTCDRDWTMTVGGLRELPELYADLLTPTRASGPGPKVDVSREPRLGLQDEPRQAREAIRAGLVAWCRILEDDYRLSLPADTIPAMAAHVRRHTPNLLRNHEHADQLCHDVRVWTTSARRYAYPARPVGRHIGDCPTMVEGVRCSGPLRAHPGVLMVVCPQCGTVDTAAGWAIRSDPRAAIPMTTAELVQWLTERVARPVTEDAIRQWASRGAITRLGKVGRMQTYDPLTVLIHAQGVRMSA